MALAQGANNSIFSFLGTALISDICMCFIGKGKTRPLAFFK